MKEKFADNKEVIRNYNSIKDKKYNGQKKNDKRTNNDLQNTTWKTKDCNLYFCVLRVSQSLVLCTSC
jgi:hypothetical protein